MSDPPSDPPPFLPSVSPSVPQLEQGSLPVCELCKGALERVRREGFLQERILPLLARFPWRCVLCHHITYRSARHRRALRREYGVSK